MQRVSETKRADVPLEMEWIPHREKFQSKQGNVRIALEHIAVCRINKKGTLL
jgi:hypothetical protein